MWPLQDNYSPVLSAFDATFHRSENCSRGRFSSLQSAWNILVASSVTSDNLLTLRGLDRIFRHGSHTPC